MSQLPEPLHLRSVPERLESVHNAKANSRDYSFQLTCEDRETGRENMLLHAFIISPWGTVRLWTMPFSVVDTNMELRGALSGITNVAVCRETTEKGRFTTRRMPMSKRLITYLAIIDAELAKL